MFIACVHAGRETKTADALTRLGYPSYAPSVTVLQRKEGKYREIQRIMFPSYVFIDIPEIPPDAYYKINSTGGVTALLSADTPLPKHEEEYIQVIKDGLDVAEGVMRHGHLIILNGKLKDIESKITKISKYCIRQNWVDVELALYGKVYTIRSSVLIDHNITRHK